MKIGIIGNMNNAYFSLTRYLRDEGFDCELLILSDEPPHFDPKCDTFSNDYTAYCRRVTWGNAGDFLKQDFSVVRKDLSPYQFLIGNGPAPAYVAKIGRALDIFIPYGYDLYSLPFLRLVHPRRQLAYAAVALYQRQGIALCGHLLFDRTNPAFEKFLTRLRYTGKRIVSPAPMVYYKDYEEGWQQGLVADDKLAAFKKLRQKTQTILVQHSRQVWKNSTDRWSYKGNQLLIKGYAQFLKKHPLESIKLVLFEYGNDVGETKKLITHLGIDEAVVWMPKMARNKLMAVLADSDVIVGELHYSWLSYGVAIEALCLGKPFMHKRTDEVYTADYPELYPMLHASSVQSVYACIQEAVQNKSGVAAIGAKGREWFLTYCVERPIAAVTAIIEAKLSMANA